MSDRTLLTQGAAIICAEGLVERIFVALAENLLKKFFQISRSNAVVTKREDLIVREAYMLEYTIIVIGVGSNICGEDILGFYVLFNSAKAFSFFRFNEIV